MIGVIIYLSSYFLIGIIIALTFRIIEREPIALGDWLYTVVLWPFLAVVLLVALPGPLVTWISRQLREVKF
jgi:hypothetical protein